MADVDFETEAQQSMEAVTRRAAKKPPTGAIVLGASLLTAFLGYQLYRELHHSPAPSNVNEPFRLPQRSQPMSFDEVAKIKTDNRLSMVPPPPPAPPASLAAATVVAAPMPDDGEARRLAEEERRRLADEEHKRRVRRHLGVRNRVQQNQVFRLSHDI